MRLPWIKNPPDRQYLYDNFVGWNRLLGTDDPSASLKPGQFDKKDHPDTEKPKSSSSTGSGILGGSFEALGNILESAQEWLAIGTITETVDAIGQFLVDYATSLLDSVNLLKTTWSTVEGDVSVVPNNTSVRLVQTPNTALGQIVSLPLTNEGLQFDLFVEHAGSGDLLEVWQDEMLIGSVALVGAREHEQIVLPLAATDRSVVALEFRLAGPLDDPSSIRLDNIVIRGQDNWSPRTEGDSYAVRADGTLVVAAQNGVLSNDMDPDGEGLLVSVVESPAFGVLSLNADGSFTYTPTPGFAGIDQFTYEASDAAGARERQTVVLNTVDSSETPMIELGGSVGVEPDESQQEFTWSVANVSPLDAVLVEIKRDSTPIFSSREHIGSFNFDSFGPGEYEIVATAVDNDHGWNGDRLSDSQVRTVTVSGAGTYGGVLWIVGTPLADKLTVAAISGAQLSVGASFLPNGARTFEATAIERIDARSLAGNDQIVVAGDVTLITQINAGDGDDLIIGGAGPSILLGGLGNDQIIGGKARNVLIGGLGADRLVGGAGSDLLIAGSTSYDDNDDALLAVLREWTSTREFGERVANISEGLGPVLSSTKVKLKKGLTVFDDADTDSLVGAAGLDWFLYDASRDAARDEKAAEGS